MRVRPSTARRRTAGFTLIELMVVVAMIMVVSALIAPSLSEIQADQRQAGTASDLVRFAHRARAATMRMHAAHLLRFREAESNDLGTVELWTGANNRCALTNWDTQAFTNHQPVDVFDMLEFNPFNSAASATDTGRQVILLRAQRPPGTARTEVRICYQPDGRTFASDNTAPGNLFPQQGPIVFTVRRTVPGSGPRGVVRQVLFPVGGMARLR